MLLFFCILHELAIQLCLSYICCPSKISFFSAAAIEKDLWANGSVNEEYLKALNSLLSNFPRLRATEPATLSIPHLVTSLKTGSEGTQEAALDSLFLLRQAWSACPAEVSKAQSVAASEAISLLQYLIQSGPPRFQEKAELLLQCLPGTLTVIIKRGNNLRQSVGNPSVYCKITLGSTPPRQTKIVSTGPTPEWDEAFAWAFDSPPKGQKLHISCKNKSKIGKVMLLKAQNYYPVHHFNLTPNFFSTLS